MESPEAIHRPCDSSLPFLSRSDSQRSDLEPAAPLEIEIGQHRRDHHETDRQRIAIGPGQLRHVLEVHAVNRGDEGRRQEGDGGRSEEHTSELQSLMRISYAVFCLKKNITIDHNNK